MQKDDSLKKTLMLGKIDDSKRRGQQPVKRLASITKSMDMSLSTLWEIVKEAWHAAVLGLRRAGHDLATE